MVVRMGVGMAMVVSKGGDKNREQGRKEDKEMDGDHLVTDSHQLKGPYQNL